MKKSINFHDFEQAFNKLRPDNFSDEGLEVLWDYFESFEYSTGIEIELDVIAFCCEYTEDTWQNIADNYSIPLDHCDDDEEKINEVERFLENHTILCGEVSDGFVYADF